MSWIHRNLPWLLLAGVLAATALTAGVLVAGTLAVVASLLGGAGIATVLGSAAAVLGVAVTLAAVDAVLAVALLVTAARRASLPTSPRTAALLRSLGRVAPGLGNGLADRFEPTVEERKRRLKRRYVDGELSELEFERRLRDLLDEAEADGAEADEAAGERVRRVRSGIDRDRERGGERGRRTERE